jgi:hypothetical protein
MEKFDPNDVYYAEHERLTRKLEKRASEHKLFMMTAHIECLYGTLEEYHEECAFGDKSSIDNMDEQIKKLVRQINVLEEERVAFDKQCCEQDTMLVADREAVKALKVLLEYGDKQICSAYREENKSGV